MSDALRDYLIEHIRNAFKHGKAKEVSMKVEPNKITVIDNGNTFNVRELLNITKRSGGHVSLNTLLTRFDSQIALTSRREKKRNVLSIGVLKNLTDIQAITPCVFHLQSHQDLIRLNASHVEIQEFCNEYFVVLPKFVSPSDVGLLGIKFKYLQDITQTLIFIVPHCSHLVKESLLQTFPSAHLIEIQ